MGYPAKCCSVACKYSKTMDVASAAGNTYTHTHTHTQREREREREIYIYKPPKLVPLQPLDEVRTLCLINAILDGRLTYI